MNHPPKVVDEARDELNQACCVLLADTRARSNRSADADDIAQDACIRVLALPEPERVRDPLRYLVRITRNLFVDRQRARKREAAIFDETADVEYVSGGSIDPERVVAGRQELQRVLDAIGDLPPRCREAFTLHRFHGLSYAAIARRMGVSTSMVEKHIAEAMLRLNRKLREEVMP